MLYKVHLRLLKPLRFSAHLRMPDQNDKARSVKMVHRQGVKCCEHLCTFSRADILKIGKEIPVLCQAKYQHKKK